MSSLRRTRISCVGLVLSLVCVAVGAVQDKINSKVTHRQLRSRRDLGQELLQAVQSVQVFKTEKLLSRGANVDERDEYGGFCLGWAAYSGNIQIAEDLLQAGAKVNDQDAFGVTSLMVAVYYNNIRMVQLLLDAGADTRIENRFGQTALTYAMEGEYWDIAEILRNPNLDEEQNFSPPPPEPELNSNSSSDSFR